MLIRCSKGFVTRYSSIRVNRLFSTHDGMSEPPAPIDFVNNFVLPPQGFMILDELNRHPNDHKIKFDEKSHTYHYDSKPMKLSVTQFISKFFPKFDEVAVATNMINGSNWPRKEYLKRDGTPMNLKEILEKWSYIGLWSQNKGSWMHYNIERVINGVVCSSSVPEIGFFKKFYSEHVLLNAVEPYRTEWRIAAPDLGLAGSIDFVGRKPDGTFVIMDWKRSKGLKSEFRGKYNKFASHPISHIEDCSGMKYSLQVNTYKYILEKYYDMTISGMTIASFHPNDGAYFSVEAPNLSHEVESLVATLSTDVDLPK